MIDGHDSKSTIKRVTKDDYLVRWRWYESYPNGQTVTTEPRESTCFSIDEVNQFIQEIKSGRKPMSGMKLEYKVWHVVEELIDEQK